MRLKDKVAIVTGGAEGIGRSYALGLAKEGARVVIADINQAAADKLVEMLKKDGKEALALKVDVSSQKDTEEMARKTIEQFRSIDILINNAAIYSRVKLSMLPLYQIDPAEWSRVMAVNVNGIFLCCRAVLPQMMKQKSGKIINIASSLAYKGLAKMTHYVTSKGAVVSLTRALAREVGEYNINVNCIAPGSTFSEDPGSEGVLESRKREIPERAIKRVEYPEDLVGTAVFLASADSDFIAGQTILVDGGVIMH